MPTKCNDRTELAKQLDQVIERNKDLPGPIIQILHEAQNIYGYLPLDVLKYVAGKLGVPQSEVYGVATFYHLFHLKPKGKYQIRVCLGTACYIRGGPTLVDVIKTELGIDIGGITEDGMFSVEAVRCIGACGLAPVMMVNDKVYHRLISPAKTRAVIREYQALARQEAKATA